MQLDLYNYSLKCKSNHLTTNIVKLKIGDIYIAIAKLYLPEIDGKLNTM